MAKNAIRFYFLWLVTIRSVEACLTRQTVRDTANQPDIATDILISDDGSCLATTSDADSFSKELKSHSNQLTFDLYNVTIDCSYLIQANDPYTRVMVDFRWFDVNRRYGFPNDNCDHASVRIFDGPIASSSQLGDTLCGTDRPTLVLSSGSILTMRFQTSGDFSVMDFRAIYTAFSDNTSCSSFTCTTTGRCIDSTVTCDSQGYGNCGDEDFSDQEDVNCPVIYTSPDLRPLLYAALALILPFLFLLYFCFWRPGYMVWACGCWRRRSLGDCGWCCPVRSQGLCRRICTCGRRATKMNSVGNLREGRKIHREKML
nr:uncharacterized protein LOC129278149 [Lytechinus pictus]